MVKQPTMTAQKIAEALARGASQCIVEACSDGSVCWDINDSREREPIHNVKQGERLWCWNFKEPKTGEYTHDYANMAPINVAIQTDVTLKLVYVTDDGDDPALYETSLDKSPNII
jgi:hypothetical protein